ncbi:hypothetical protein AV530_000542 [Patagioenas fasciata monilis]|uniref:Uncharacterized protein n=1 Tax=Patagioenas fasciata monilis TaxID=372326 RepID=A0A1V4IG13_PATFA|nr:hypothetical protein AV530_000542 [Patagioenas fasciata monilis]
MVQNAWMCPSVGPPEGQNATGIPATKSCPEVGVTGFPQASAYLLDKSPGEETSDTDTQVSFEGKMPLQNSKSKGCV